MEILQWSPLHAQTDKLLVETLARIKPKVIYDLGANTGGFIQQWIDTGAKKIICFEPVPDMCQALGKKYTDDPIVEIFRIGISDHIHSIENLSVFNAWSLAEDGTRRDKALDYLEKPSFKVDFINLDNLCHWGDYAEPDFIKMDIDGAEFRALKGGRNFLKNRPPIYFEFSHLPFFIYGENPQEMCELIYELGYEAVSLDGWVCPSAAEMMKYYPEGSSYDIMLLPKN